MQELFNYDSNLFIQSFLDGNLESALATLNNQKPDPQKPDPQKPDPQKPDGGDT